MLIFKPFYEDPIYIVIFAMLALILIALIIVIAVLLARRKNDKKAKTIDKINVIDGVRYNEEKAADRQNAENVALVKGDIILQHGKTYKAVKNGFLMPGKYTMYSSNGNNQKVNVRLGGYVKEYGYKTEIVLAEGDEICGVSDSIILR